MRMKRALGIICDCIEDRDTLENLELIKEAGFDSFFSNEFSVKRAVRLKEKADTLGLDYEFIHGPYKNINTMWEEGDGYLGIMSGMKEAIDAAHEAGVAGVILHTSSGWFPPEICDTGLRRFDSVVEYAEKKGVIAVFENLRKVGNLAYFVDRYEKCDAVRFCYDFGHEHAYTKTVCFADIFTDRIWCTHIHDNHGRGWAKEGNTDEHLLPFEGSVDYKSIMKKLNFYNYRGSLMLEVFKNRALTKTSSDEEFLKLCYKKLVKISKM